MKAYQTHTTNPSDILALALQAAEAGLAVFPLRGKFPAIRKCPESEAQGLGGEALAEHARTCGRAGHGFHDARTERSRVIALFNAAPDATGYGIATGSPSRRIVDGPDGLREAQRLGLTSEYVVRTGR